KYLGIILSAAVGVAILGAVLMICMWLRVPTDYQLNTSSLNEDTLKEIWEVRIEILTGMVMQLFLTWLQISVLGAVGVAVSTRFSLVVNLPTVIILYFAGNLTRFLFPLSSGPLADKSPVLKGAVWGLSLILPYLQAFDLKSLTL